MEGGRDKSENPFSHPSLSPLPPSPPLPSSPLPSPLLLSPPPANLQSLAMTEASDVRRRTQTISGPAYASVGPTFMSGMPTKAFGSTGTLETRPRSRKASVGQVRDGGGGEEEDKGWRKRGGEGREGRRREVGR